MRRVHVIVRRNKSDDRKPDCNRKRKPFAHMIVSKAKRRVLLDAPLPVAISRFWCIVFDV